MKMKKEDIARGLKFGVTQKKDDLTIHVGNKVLPINESITSSSSSKNQCTNLNLNSSPSNNMKNNRGDGTRSISRMKELLRWASNAKSDKGGKYITRKVLQFRNKTILKSVQGDDQTVNESPKISFRWELESCSSALSISSSNNLDGNSSLTTPRSGNWITTDSDCKSL